MAADDLATTLRTRLAGRAVDWVLVCGSGVGRGLLQDDGLGLADRIEVPSADLGLPAPTVAGHAGSVVWGRVGTSGVLAQAGRLHPYEGHDAATCTRLLAAAIDLGAERVVLTCAVGALNPDLEPGQLAVLRDQINLWGPTPLAGPDFVDCGELYSRTLRDRLGEIARAMGALLPEVVYAYGRGPQYETPAEVAALRGLGGDVVGMSTTYEAILAAAKGVETCGVAIVTNTAGISGLSHEEVGQRSAAATQRLATLLRTLIENT